MTSATQPLRGPLRKRESSGGKPGNGTTDYAWFVWERGHTGARVIDWLRRDA